MMYQGNRHLTSGTHFLESFASSINLHSISNSSSSKQQQQQHQASGTGARGIW